MEMTFNEMIKLRDEIYELEWTNDELISLPKKYTKLMVHIALERADADNDIRHFVRILSTRRELLTKHIEATLGVFEWNYIDIIKTK
jgi:hypothetical protein